ncbi:MAG: hypothetical protein ACKPEY_19305 [Planctomycetota bacterium]
MPIVVTCRCGKSYSANDQLAGKSLPCPNCQAVIQVPAGNGDPLGLGGAVGVDPFAAAAGHDPFAAGAASPGQPGYAQPAYGQQSYGPGFAGGQSAQKKGSSKGLILGLITALGGLALIGLVLVVLFVVVPALGLGQSVTWIPHTSADAAYSVDFPGTPVREDKSQATPMGSMSMKMDKVVLEKSRGEFQVMMMKLPIPEAQARLLAGFAADQMMEQMTAGLMKTLPESKITATQSIKLGTNLGREIEVEFKRDNVARQLHIRSYLVGARVYVLGWEGLAGKEPTKITDHFFESFKINDPPPEAAGGKAGGGPGIPGLPNFPNFPNLPGFAPAGKSGGGGQSPAPPSSPTGSSK